MDDLSDSSLNEREARLQLARERILLRSALVSAAAYGYYVFEDLMTENAGLIDFLAIGPPAVIAIVIRSEHGSVTRGFRYEQELLLDGQPFADDPRRQAQELSVDATLKVFAGQQEVLSLICFIHADIEIVDRKIPIGTTSLWELPWALDPEGEEIQFTPADIEEIAEKVQRVYGRPPIITPNRDRLWEEGS